MLPKAATYDKPQVAPYRMFWDASFDLPLHAGLPKFENPRAEPLQLAIYWY